MSEPLPFTPENTLETWIQLEAHNSSAIGGLYQSLYTEQLFVILRISLAEQDLAVRTEVPADIFEFQRYLTICIGKYIYIVVFSSADRLAAVVPAWANAMSIGGPDLFRDSRGKQFVLNPGFEYCRLFDQNEIERMLASWGETASDDHIPRPSWWRRMFGSRSDLDKALRNFGSLSAASSLKAAMSKENERRFSHHPEYAPSSDRVIAFSKAISRLSAMDCEKLHWQGYEPLVLVERMVREIEDSLSSGSGEFSPSDIRYLSIVGDVDYDEPDGFPGPHPLTKFICLQGIRERASAAIVQREMEKPGS